MEHIRWPGPVETPFDKRGPVALDSRAGLRTACHPRGHARFVAPECVNLWHVDPAVIVRRSGDRLDAATRSVPISLLRRLCLALMAFSLLAPAAVAVEPTLRDINLR